jgi:hypothetical protein
VPPHEQLSIRHGELRIVRPHGRNDLDGVHRTSST